MIERPNEYADLSLAERTVILKIHGEVDRTSPDWAWDSFVITEDHYIDYLTHTDISNLVPVKVAAKLRRSHFLFLGYSLRDWNLRVMRLKFGIRRPRTITITSTRSMSPPPRTARASGLTPSSAEIPTEFGLTCPVWRANAAPSGRRRAAMSPL